MTIEDIRAAMIAASAISEKVSTRIFSRSPIDVQTADYINIFRSSKTRDMVSETSRFDFEVFSTGQKTLEQLCEILIAFFENKKTYNSNFYYSAALLSQTDGRQKLDDGFYWSILTFEFKKTT